MRLAGSDGGPLLGWYDANGRDLPWRRTKDPYAVWVSEVMLQQTQVATVLPYYDRWMKRFPTHLEVADADEQELLALWQGLGYYRRCRLLKQGTQFVRDNGFPTDYDGWRKVPGVGPYTAAALASICSNQPSAVVDGNVERVYARVASDPSTGSELLRKARLWAQLQMYDPRPGDWNQAVMELGATICTPRQPNCSKCPIEEFCTARQTWRVEDFPTKVVRPPTVRHYYQVVIPFAQNQFGLQQIGENQWWQGMWQFPTSQTTEHEHEPEAEWEEYLGQTNHMVTHHRLTFDIWLKRTGPFSENLQWVSLSDLQGFALPSPQRKALSLALVQLGLPVAKS